MREQGRTKDDLEAEYGAGSVWNTSEMLATFVLLAHEDGRFRAQRKSDKAKGWLWSQQGRPCLFYNFIEDLRAV
jgi:hypothetical protein